MNREEWLESAVAEVRPVFTVFGSPLPKQIRVTCGFPSRNARSRLRSVGEHWSPKASSDGTHEILISPVLSASLDVLGTLVHELCHAATDGDGHGAKFTRLARKMSLEGKPTETTAGDKFKTAFADLLDGLGMYPHAKLNVGFDKKTQSTRMHKASCQHCGYTIRLSQKWANVGIPDCPDTDHGALTLE